MFVCFNSQDDWNMMPYFALDVNMDFGWIVNISVFANIWIHSQIMKGGGKGRLCHYCLQYVQNDISYIDYGKNRFTSYFTLLVYEIGQVYCDCLTFQILLREKKQQILKLDCLLYCHIC